MTLKRLLLGRRLATTEEHHQRLPKRLGLPVFASDAISSTAYATEEILLILVPVAGLAALHLLVPISIVVVVVLAIVVTSYRQTIHAYPSGGGAYIVARDNLGRVPALVAGAALLVDYTLTVAVSISAGVAAVLSVYPGLRDARVTIALAVVVFIALVNLRGTRESGALFAVPTYLYIVALALLIGVGLWRLWFGDLQPLVVDQRQLDELTGGGATVGLAGMGGLLVLARAFSSGAVALTGTEAITNGVQAFRPPEARNAARTLVAMACILGAFFFGISLLADTLRPMISEQETLLSAMGSAVFGHGSPPYLLLQFTTMGILFLAANTAFADFPRLSSIIARDGYLPRQLAHRGDRLVFSNGIVALSLTAGVLLAAFEGSTTALIPLYAVGVFTGFTISQIGMVRHHARLRQGNWRAGQVVNGVGAAATALVLVTVVVSKFTTGAWIPAIVIPAIVLLVAGIHRHYAAVAAALRVPEGWRPRHGGGTHAVVMLVGGVHRGTLEALAYARSIAPDRFHAVHVAESQDGADRVRRAWHSAGIDVALDVVIDPYRQLQEPLLAFIDDLHAQCDDGSHLTVVIPEFTTRRWWERLLHNQSAWVLKARLARRPHTVTVSVPLVLGATTQAPPPALASATTGRPGR
ncbi:MAG TPA: APC family permease [Euzebyales bacterium]|nr:APC family permease [Euzebyales bacterium]